MSKFRNVAFRIMIKANGGQFCILKNIAPWVFNFARARFWYSLPRQSFPMPNLKKPSRLEIYMFISQSKTAFPWARERVSERASEWEPWSACKASSVEQVNELALRANEQVDQQMAQYSTRQFHILSTHCAVAAVMAKGVFVLARVIFQRHSITTGAVFHETALHGGYKQHRIGM